MHLTVLVQNESEAFVNLHVTPDMTLGTVKSLVENDVKIPAANQKLFFNNQALIDDLKTLEAEGIGDGDLITVHEHTPPRPDVRRPGPPRDEAELLRIAALTNPNMLAQIRNRQPQLAEAVGNQQQFKAIWEEIHREQKEKEAEKLRNIERLNADPFDVEAQREIEESIRQAAVMQNLELAVQETPEIFGRVHMLYIPVEVNGVSVKAFVDSGAQTTIMSPDCAERCGVMRLIDRRFSGEARGVGTAKILGRVHVAQIKVGKFFLASSFTVMEGKDVDLLLGLDMLKRHQASIDLKKNVLRIDDDETPFLGEGDLPKEAFGAEEPMVQGPGGLQMGGRSGALIPPSLEAQTAGPSSSSPQQQSQPQQQQTQQQPATSQPSQVHQAQSRNASRFPQEHIDQLIGLGFSQEEVVQALELAGGNVEVAAGILYG